MLPLLGQAVESLAAFIIADLEYSDQVESMEGSVLEYHKALTEGREAPDLRLFVECELMSVEEKAHKLAQAVKLVTARLRSVYDLRREGYSAGGHERDGDKE